MGKLPPSAGVSLKRVAWVELRIVGAALLVATFVLARLGLELTPYAYLWVLTLWVVMCAALTTRTSDRDEDALLERFLGRRAR